MFIHVNNGYNCHRRAHDAQVLERVRELAFFYHSFFT